MRRYRNSQKRIIDKGLIYFITIITKNRYPYFKNDILCELFIEELKLCKKLKGFKLYAFNILYEHVHLLIEPSDEYNISKVMKSLKENFSRDANRLLGSNKSLSASDTSTCRIPIRSFLVRHETVTKHNNSNRIQNLIKFKWQRSYFDHIIRNDHDFEWHYDYTEVNHQKHFDIGYPEDYRYSSENYSEIIDEYDL